MPDTAATLWLPGHALNCYEGNAHLRNWLTHPGLLTERVRDADPARFALNVLQEAADGADHLREIELCSGGRPWIVAQTRVPAATLAAHSWLTHIGGKSLGTALAEYGAMPGASVTRSELAYAQLCDDRPLIALALARAALPSQALWTRRSTFAIDGSPLQLLEVFLPVVGAGKL